MEFFVLSEYALETRVEVEQVLALARAIAQNPPRGMTESVSAFSSVTVLFDPFVTTARDVEQHIRSLNLTSVVFSKREIHIPVCYDLGLDWQEVEQHTALSQAEIIRRHTSGVYHVQMIGFMPGFPYLRGLDAALFTPRKTTPRAQVPAGSVGLAGKQTGIYPVAVPAGWNIIGRTSLKLFDPRAVPPAVLQAGDTVRFYAVSKEEFDASGA